MSAMSASTSAVTRLRHRLATIRRVTRFEAHLIIVLAAGLATILMAQPAERRWLAGDSHIHSHWSPGYDRTQNPPEPLIGRDAMYPTPINAQMARRYGLAWMVTTDHGGPNHSKLNATRAYAELEDSRRAVPDLLQFYGLELNMPAMDHHTLIIPHHPDEWSMLFEIERRFDANEVFPVDPARRTEAAALAALDYMKALPRLPLVFANHPSRSARGLGVYGLDEPRELRVRHDAAPEIYRGMEGAPGHQAGGLAYHGLQKLDKTGAPAGFRGGYANAGAHTLGGFDQMTAVVGGLWDALLGEGRRFWIVATSDSHVNYTETSRSGSDFWPGQFHKTYVHARPTYADVLDALRAGRIFAVAGDLITALDVTASVADRSADAGGTLRVAPGERVRIRLRFHDPETPNHRGDNPRVRRVDVIVGELTGPSTGERDELRAGQATAPDSDRNETTKVFARLDAEMWRKESDDGTYSVEVMLPPAGGSMYVRVRGTSSPDLEPQMDERGENPWMDLWFYSNPIFVEADRTTAQH